MDSGTSRPLVLDSWPMMEWLKGREPARAQMASLFSEASAGKVRLLLDRLNVGEIYYLTARDSGIAAAETLLAELSRAPIQIFEPSAATVMQAARLKAQWTMSYADAFTAALAVRFGAPVVTGDADFLPLQAAGLLQVVWVGR